MAFHNSLVRTQPALQKVKSSRPARKICTGRGLEEVAGSGRTQDPRVKGCFHNVELLAASGREQWGRGKSGSMRITTAAVDRSKVEETQEQQQYKSVSTSTFQQNTKDTFMCVFVSLFYYESKSQTQAGFRKRGR